MRITRISTGFSGMALDVEVQHAHTYLFSNGMKSHNSMKGVLETKSEDTKSTTETSPEKTKVGISSFILRSDGPRRPDSLPCDIHYVHANNQDFIVLAGLLNGSLYEIFVDEQNGHDLRSHKTGHIIKKGKGEYSLIGPRGEVLVEGLSKNFNGTWGTLARMISMSLRHGVPLQFIIDQLQRSKEFLGFEKAVSRVLKHYIKEGETFEILEKCPSCGYEKLNIIGGCPTCPSCGYSKCS